MHSQPIRQVRSTFTPIAPGAACIDEAPAPLRVADSIALHRWARRQRSRMIGDVLVRAWTALAAWTGRLLDAFAVPAAKRNPRTDVI